MWFLGMLLVVVVGVFLVYGLYRSMYLRYPDIRALRVITKEAAFTTATAGLRRYDIYDKDGNIRCGVQRRMDDWQDTYLLFLRDNADAFEKVLVEHHWLDEKHQIKARKAFKISNDFLDFYNKMQEND